MSMGVVDRNSDRRLPRAEWQAWRDGLYANRKNMERLPTFGDCGIQHPSGVEGFDPKKMQGSAAVRYALLDEWLLIKGVGTKVTPPSQQFPRLAQKLVAGPLADYFAGMNHCVGCDGVWRASRRRPNLGSLEVWRKLGTIHHITRVVEDLASLTWT